MNTTISQYFPVLDRASPSSLHEQIYAGLRKWVPLLQPGQRLPSERELAALAKVDRSTVKNAIARLVRENVVVRNVRGTFKTKAAEDFDQRPHPFALGANASRSLDGVPLRIVLFENWPTQQMVWTRMVDLFNQTHPDLRVEIEWLPRDVNSLDRYKEFIRSERPDVALLSREFAGGLQRDRMLTPLPDDLSRALRGPAYHSEILCPAESALLPWVAPMHFGPWGVLWNEDLVGDFDEAIVSDLTLSRLVQWFGAVGQRLPRKGCLLAETWCLPLVRGFPVKSMTEAALERFFHDSFAAMEALQGLSARFLWVATHPRQSGKLFMEGQAAFYLGALGYIFNTIPVSRVPWKGAWVVPENGCFLPTGWSGVGIPRASAHPDFAAKLVRFLASSPAQDEIATGHINAAFLSASNRRLPSFPGNREPNRRVAFRGLYSNGNQTHEGQDLVCNDLQFLFREVMEGQRTARDAMNLAMEMARRKFAGRL
ncbi:MAG: extracellular solute-binding protein [Verrucomicrobia bacterium]|nr:extracellular solute-binding protein [Verrucomicrobiota bacterium]